MEMPFATLLLRVQHTDLLLIPRGVVPQQALLKMGKLRHRVGELLARSHTANKWQSRGLNTHGQSGCGILALHRAEFTATLPRQRPSDSRT